MAVTFNKAPSASKTPETPNPFDKLSDTAKSVSAATRRMNDAVEHLNEALKKLNLGVTVWDRYLAWTRYTRECRRDRRDRLRTGQRQVGVSVSGVQSSTPDQIPT